MTRAIKPVAGKYGVAGGKWVAVDLAAMMTTGVRYTPSQVAGLLGAGVAETRRQVQHALAAGTIRQAGIRRGNSY